MTKCMRNFALLMTFAMVVSLPAVAQQTALTGTVSDPTGAVIPGAEVTLTHKGTGATRNTTSGADGGYILAQLEPGQYRLEISMAGFRTQVQDPVILAVGISSTANVTLEVGAIAETIEVKSTVAGINTVDASLGVPISGTQVLNLPSYSLDPAALLSLQPGVTFVPGASDSPGGYSDITDFDGRGGSVNGARSDQTNITLDGVDVNDAENGFAFTSALRATQASLAEFRVTTTNYNADQGRSSGAQVQLVTKSGTNTPHGMVYYSHRNEAWNSSDFFNNAAGVEKGKLRRHIYGVALGGPIKKDRLFLFGNFERLEHAEGSTTLRDVPSNAFRDGVLIYECDVPAACPGGSVNGLTGPHTVAAGFFGLTPADMLSLDPGGIGVNPAIITYLTQFPSPNASGNFDDLNLKGFRFNSPIDNTFNTYIARADFNIDAAGNHTLFARGTLHDDAIVSAGPAYPGNDPNQLLLGNSRGIALGYKAVLSPTVVNNLRYGYTRIGEKFSGQRNSEFADLRFIDELNGFDGAASTRLRTLPQHHLRNDLSVTRGSHTLSAGFEARFTRNNRSTNIGAFNTFTVNPSWVVNVGRNLQPGSSDCVNTTACNSFPAVAGVFAGDYAVAGANLLGLLTQIDGNFNFLPDGTVQASGDPIVRRFAVDEYETYFQDQWRLTPTLTLTAGARFFVTSPPWETEGRQVTPTPNLGDWFETRRVLALNGLPTNDAGQIGFALGGPANGGRDYYDWDWNNWSPRLALAWAPRGLGWFGNGKLVIRGGWSLVYDRIGNALATTFDAGGSFGMATGITSTFGGCDEGGDPSKPDCARFTGPLDTAAATAVSLPATPAASFPAVPPGADASGNLAPGAFAISQALDSSITTPYAHVMNLTISRELPGNLVVETSYVGRRGRNLLISRDLAMPANLCDPISGTCYIEAVQQLIALNEAGQSASTIGSIPYWENLFPAWAGAGGATATESAFNLINAVHPDTTSAQFFIDLFAFPGYMTCPGRTDIDGDGFGDCPFALFDDQFATLNAWSSIARSEYHSFQFSVRRRLVNGIQFTVNYALSHSLDHSSTPERQGIFGFSTGGGSGTTINAWDLDQEYSNSDFDMRHQLNANWYVELPFGHGKAAGGGIPGWANQIIGGWEVSGIFRANSGLPANISNGFGSWPTNWQLTGNGTCKGQGGSVTGVQVGPCAPTQNVKDTVNDDGPNLFSDPDAAFDFWRKTLPGDRGGRNNIRADNYVNLDLSIGKSFPMPWEGHSFKFRWEIFNVTNSVYFDAVSLRASLASQGSFGNYNSVMGGARSMQVNLRYEF